jgi:hypothetical protein
MDNSRLIQTLQAEREGYEALLKAIGPERSIQAGVEGEYSVKDIVAHLATYERWLVGWLQAALNGRLPAPSAMEDPEVESRNKLFYSLNRDRELDDVLAESRAVFGQLMALIEKLPEADLDNPDRTAWCVVPYWKKSLPLWQAIQNDTSEHYQQHRPALEAWLRAGHPQVAPHKPAWVPRLPRLTRASKAGDSGD